MPVLVNKTSWEVQGADRNVKLKCIRGIFMMWIIIDFGCCSLAAFYALVHGMLGTDNQGVS
jgi:hypothetical protein